MSILDVILGKSISLDEAEEELGRPDKAEETDLALHVTRCAKRWALSYRASRNNSAQLAQVRLMLAVITAIAVLYIPAVQNVVKSVLHLP